MAKMTELEKQNARLEKEYYKTHKRIYKLSAGDITFNIINYLFFGLFTFTCIFPFYYLFIQTISGRELVTKGAITFIPRAIQFKNYTDILNNEPILTAFGVSIARTLIGTTLSVLASGLIGYLVTQERMWHRKFWYRFMIITMYFNAGMIPWVMNMRLLGLTGNFLAYILPGIVAPYNIILVKTYIESIPDELEESAFIDGAGYMTVFRKIIWPLCKPILATIAIFGAVGHWNSFTDSLMLMTDSPKLYTLQHLLYNFLRSAEALKSQMNTQTGVDTAQLTTSVVQYTVSMITIIPILVVYPFLQRYFEKGIMLGAVKG
ncbi:MAG: carbohydrate ABC transporter permease [Lachnospiraceae bacterium]|nr:carbohydrate ABC transporter permease [Lachnospiraceae bacterium]